MMHKGGAGDRLVAARALRAAGGTPKGQAGHGLHDPHKEAAEQPSAKRGQTGLDRDGR